MAWNSPWRHWRARLLRWLASRLHLGASQLSDAASRDPAEPAAPPAASAGPPAHWLALLREHGISGPAGRVDLVAEPGAEASLPRPVPLPQPAERRREPRAAEPSATPVRRTGQDAGTVEPVVGDPKGRPERPRENRPARPPRFSAPSAPQPRDQQEQNPVRPIAAAGEPPREVKPRFAPGATGSLPGASRLAVPADRTRRVAGRRAETRWATRSQVPAMETLRVASSPRLPDERKPWPVFSAARPRVGSQSAVVNEMRWPARHEGETASQLHWVPQRQPREEPRLGLEASMAPVVGRRPAGQVVSSRTVGRAGSGSSSAPQAPPRWSGGPADSFWPELPKEFGEDSQLDLPDCWQEKLRQERLDREQRG